MPGLGGGPRRTGLARWIDGVLRTATFPTVDYELGQFHYFGGDMRGAETHFGRAIRDSQGAFPDFYNNLGTVLYYQERLEPARRALLVYVDHARPSPFALRTLAEIDQRLD